MGQFWRGREWPTSTLCPAMRELTSRNANVLRYSESAANLLVDNGSNFAIFSECALISKEKLSDFDSAISQHRYEAMVNEIARRDNVPKTVAAARARREFPDLYDDYQASVGVKKTYEQLIGEEIKKGFSDLVARQRIAALYPVAARETITKSAASASVREFMAKVDEIKKARGCSRTAAMSAARREHPDLFARFENVV
jgi:hypothetical protein